MSEHTVMSVYDMIGWLFTSEHAWIRRRTRLINHINPIYQLKYTAAEMPVKSMDACDGNLVCYTYEYTCRE